MSVPGEKENPLHDQDLNSEELSSEKRNEKPGDNQVDFPSTPVREQQLTEKGKPLRDEAAKRHL